MYILHLILGSAHVHFTNMQTLSWLMQPAHVLLGALQRHDNKIHVTTVVHIFHLIPYNLGCGAGCDSSDILA